ncbi:GumC domain-containing protein [Vaginella massiliensis]|uniref:hypothetical protein n=1 Tax=Vaginella massiliensis TaxID=1816680 RepID=UPI0008391878|nr:hypothetical protein [Vaginella massiliensis]
MDNINKIIAITLDRSYDGNGGNCKVIGVEVDNKYIDDPDRMQEIFHTSGVIYSNKIYEYGDNVQVKDLIEIIPSKINFEISENRNIYVGLKKVNKIGVPVIDIPTDYIAEDYLDLENISKFLFSRNLIPDYFSRIYLCDSTDIFGPFKVENKKVLPVIGKETNAFEYHIEELIEDEDLDYLYLIEEPHTKIKSIDCSTPAQLVEFLKDRIAIDRADLNLILKVGAQISSINNKQIGLDAVRLKRAEKYLNQLTLSFEQLYKLGENKDWAEVVKNSINKHKEDFEAYFKKGLEDSLAAVESLLKEKKNDLVSYEELVKDEQQKLQDVKDQIQIIESKKDEIVTTIKIMANLQPQIFSNGSTIDEDINPVEFVSYLNGSPVFTDLDDFYDELKDEFNFRFPNQDKYEDGLILLKDNRFLLAKSVEFVLNLLAHVGDAKIAIQHAEADWLKFKLWKDNGLLSVIKQASTDEKYHYFYVLQDFNIASFECYGKPILDITNRIRMTVDGVHIMPSNLTIILIPTDEEIDDFGFDLNPSTFRNWKCLPNLSSINLIQFPTNEVIDLKNITFNRAVQDYSEQYF